MEENEDKAVLEKILSKAVEEGYYFTVWSSEGIETKRTQDVNLAIEDMFGIDDSLEVLFHDRDEEASIGSIFVLIQGDGIPVFDYTDTETFNFISDIVLSYGGDDHLVVP